MMSLRTDLRACILHGVDPSVLLRGPRLRRAILRHTYRRSLRGPDLFSRFFFGCPGLELLEQFFSEDRLAPGSDWLAVLGLALTDLGLPLNGSLGLAWLGRFHNRSNFLALRRVRRCRRRNLRAGNCLSC